MSHQAYNCIATESRDVDSLDNEWKFEQDEPHFRANFREGWPHWAPGLGGCLWPTLGNTGRADRHSSKAIGVWVWHWLPSCANSGEGHETAADAIRGRAVEEQHAAGNVKRTSPIRWGWCLSFPFQSTWALRQWVRCQAAAAATTEGQGRRETGTQRTVMRTTATMKRNRERAGVQAG